MRAIGLFIFIVVTLYSCKSQGKNNLILGAWILQKDNKPVNEKLVFNSDNTIFVQSLLNGVPRTERVMNYQISADGKSLSMNEKDGNHKSLKSSSNQKMHLNLRQKII